MQEATTLAFVNITFKDTSINRSLSVVEGGFSDLHLVSTPLNRRIA
jgi:hypothetical protein